MGTYKRHTIDSIRDMATNNNVELLSKTYVNNNAKLKFRCPEGHEFEKSIKQIQRANVWCTICSKGRAEELCRYILEQALDAPFHKVHVYFEGHRLELDGYNDSLKTAFEYNGKQHYELTYMTKTERELQYRKHLDELKRKYCEMNGINLMVIPHTVDYTSMPSFISKEFGLDTSSVSVEEFSKNYSYYNIRQFEILSMAQEKGGSLVSYNINTSTVTCSVGHTWTTNYATLKRGHWCAKCFYERKVDATNSKDYNLKRFNLAMDCIKKDGIVCLTDSSQYHGSDTAMVFKCKEGHVFKEKMAVLTSIVRNKVSNRRSCPHCLRGRQTAALDKMKAMGLSLVDPLSYKNKHQKLKWICSKGHIHTRSLKNIVEHIRVGYAACPSCGE